MEILLYYAPLVFLFIIYYKVFRIADDIKDIKKMLGDNKDANLP